MTNTEDHEALPFNLTDLDREVLSQTDEEFVYHDWEEMRSIVGRRILTRGQEEYLTEYSNQQPRSP